MTVITFTGRTKRPRTAAPPPAAPAAVTGSFGSPSGRTGTFVGSYRLERCLSRFGQLAAAGVFTGELTDADGRSIGIGARRTTVAVQVVSTATGLLVQIGPLDVNLLGFLVGVDELSVDVRGTSCKDAVREALEVSDQPPVAPGDPALTDNLPRVRPTRRPGGGRSGAPSDGQGGGAVAAVRPGPLMAATAGERHELLQERRLLQDILALIRRCHACPPVPLLDAVLSGTSAVRPALPTQPYQCSP